MKFYAHTAEDENGQQLPECSGRWQALTEHLRNVAALARRFAEPLGLCAEAELLGFLHDLGKYSEKFQARLNDNSIRGINHWSVGAFQAWQLGRFCAALAVEGHHTGIPAMKLNHDKLESWASRYRKFQCPSTAASVNGFEESLSVLLERFARDGFALPAPVPNEKAAGCEFATALRIRMLFSCLVDADFLDTEKHFDSAQAGQRSSPALGETEALRVLLNDLEGRSCEGEVNQLRRALLRDCLAAAESPESLFTLTAPTGSGKTLASLAFALKHIEYRNAGRPGNDPHRLRRVIVVIPYTSIIEQTAAVYRKLFEQGFGPNYVLEHHSAVAPRERTDDAGKDAEEGRIRRARLASENWDAPLVVTTSVQFFESLFSNRPSDCRKLHNIARSVVLFDEVQTLPRDRVPALLSAVRLLTQAPYGASAVFMTATQPAFGAAAHMIEGGWSPVEISSSPGAMAEAFKRVEVIRRSDEWRPTWDEVADALRDEHQFLVVVNTKAAARALFEALPPEDRFHLSTALCPAHRQAKLNEIRRRLDPQVNAPCRLVSTQLIEAGVDVDFPVVWRALGPLDSIIQTAGRCNREGRLPRAGRVTVFRPADHSLPRGAYRQAAAVTECFLQQQPDAPLHQPDTYTAYFRQLYGVSGPQRPDDDPLFAACKEFDFPTAARESSLINEHTKAVLVRWTDGNGSNRGGDLAQILEHQKYLSAVQCREAQRFSVNLYHNEFEEARAKGYIYRPAQGWDFWVWNSDYDDSLGVGHVKNFIW